jgi:hypothetical protein
VLAAEAVIPSDDIDPPLVVSTPNGRTPYGLTLG